MIILKKILSFLTVLVLTGLISQTSGKFYNQCTPKSRITKIFTTLNNTKVTQVKWFKEWSNTTDFLLVATYNQLYMVDVKPAGSLARHSEMLLFESEPRSHWMSIIGFCPKNEFGRIRLNPDNKLEVCGSICGEPACRFYTRKQFDSGNNQDSQYTTEKFFRNSEYIFSPRHKGSWLETERIGNNKTFVVMDSWLNKKDLMYKDIGSSDLQRRFTKTQNIKFERGSKMEFKKIIDRAESKKVLLFFNELSEFNQVSGESVKTNYAKVSQVCKNDDSKHLYSYLTLPFHCSIGEGKDTLYFRNLISVSDPIKVKLSTDSDDLEDVVFATMGVTYSYLNRTGSVVTMIKLSDVEDYFNNGDFMGKKHLDNKKSKNGNPIPNYHITHGWKNRKFNLKPLHLKTDRPGNCQEFNNASEKKLFESKSNRFFKRKETRRNMYGSLKTSKPLAQASFGEVYTSVTAFSKKGGAEVIVGSSKGKITRMYVSLTGELKSFVYEEIEVPKMENCKKESNCSIDNLMTVPKENPKDIVATFDDKVFIQPIDLCPWSSWDKLACESHFACKWHLISGKTGKCKRIDDVKIVVEKSVESQIELCKSS